MEVKAIVRGAMEEIEEETCVRFIDKSVAPETELETEHYVLINSPKNRYN